jgi:tetratricopeptide (TPR) repeat protein
MMTQRSLATSAIECARLFANLSSQLLDKEWETRTTLSQPSTEDEGARYRIWAGNLGAFQRLPATSSLDYRLMESPRVAMQIQELLEDLRHALQKISAIASGESLNRVAELTDSEDESGDDEPETESDGSEDGVDQDVIIEVDADEKSHQLSEAGELFKSVKDTITGLFRISIIIRKASPRDRFAKALAARQEPFDDRFDVDHVSHKFPMLRIKEKEWFKERAGKANTQRRKYLRYARDHRDKLAREPKDLWQPEDIGPSTILLPALSQAGKTNLTKPTSTLAPTAASTLFPERIAIEVEDSQDNQSRTSYAVSLGEDDDESHLRLPSLTEVSKDATTFECPLCWTIQDIQRDSIWRKHAFGDLKPYICTFEDCDIKLFSDRREWFEHELLQHRAQWCCDLCGKDDFRSSKIFKDHVRSRHMQGMKNDQLDALCEASRRSVDRIPASDCPFCLEWEAKLRLANPNISADEIVVVTPTQFRHHVGAHMQQLALFSIPRGFLEDDADAKSVTTLGNTRSNVAGLRKAEMTLEFGSLEDALEELRKLHEQTPDDLEIHLLLSKCYREMGNESAATVHSGRAHELRALAQSDHRSDNSTETSKELEVQVIELDKENLGADHPDTLNSVSDDLAGVLKNRGKYEEAEMMHRQALAQIEKTLGHEHPETLASMNNLAGVLKSQDKYEGAEMMYREILGLRRKILGYEHPDTLVSMNNLAGVLESQGEYEEAEMMYREILVLREQILGSDHPGTLVSMDNLARVLGSIGKHEEAEITYREILGLRRKTLGYEHPDTLVSMDNLARLLHIQGYYGKAEAMYLQTLQGYEKVFGPEATATTLYIVGNLGALYKVLGQLDEAEKMYQRALRGKEKALGPDHPSTLDTVNDLGALYKDLGRLDEAEMMYQRALR